MSIGDTIVHAMLIFIMAFIFASLFRMWWRSK
jgi:hypothetical protein